jgi:hypothetical protein
MMQFKIEQVALWPASSQVAKHFLMELGLTDWVSDQVAAKGEVYGVQDAENKATLSFNYQAAPESSLELEILDYNEGLNWMDASVNKGVVSSIGAVSHLGMHVTEDQLDEFDRIMDKYGVRIAQKVRTQSHTNPAIKDSRRYMYVIYDTRRLIGVDLKFIVRLPYQA